MTLDVAALRAQTPGTDHVVHLNNAGAALMPEPVIDTVYGFLDEEVRRGGYEAAATFSDEIEAVHASIGTLINADPSEIALQDSATRAWDIAFYGVRLAEGDRIVTTSTEYWSNLGAYLHVRDTRGVVVDVVPDTPDGDIDLDRLDAMIGPSVALVTINHVPTSSGLVNPAKAVGEITSAHGVPYLLDACQSVGQVPIDVDEIGCDMLSATSRKWLRGPRGAGFLYVDSGFMDRLDHPTIQILGGSEVYPDHIAPRPDARRFETWEKSFALALGLGAATDYALDLGVDAMWDRIESLGASARERLAAVPGVTIRDRGSVLGGIVTFTVDGHDAFEIRNSLRTEGINVSVATDHSSPIDMTERNLSSVIRASFHVYNTDEEADLLAESIGRIT